jgi:hypothetical protein
MSKSEHTESGSYTIRIHMSSRARSAAHSGLQGQTERVTKSTVALQMRGRPAFRAGTAQLSALQRAYRLDRRDPQSPCRTAAERPARSEFRAKPFTQSQAAGRLSGIHEPTDVADVYGFPLIEHDEHNPIDQDTTVHGCDRDLVGFVVKEDQVTFVPIADRVDGADPL